MWLQRKTESQHTLKLTYFCWGCHTFIFDINYYDTNSYNKNTFTIPFHSLIHSLDNLEHSRIIERKTSAFLNCAVHIIASIGVQLRNVRRPIMYQY